MTFYEEYHEDNGTVVGGILLCLPENGNLPTSYLSEIVKNLAILDPKKAALISLNPQLIKEETEFYLANKIYELSDHAFKLIDREKAKAYCGHYIDENLKVAVLNTLKAYGEELEK